MLKALDARNTNAAQPNGLFASHPDTQARLDGIAKTIKEQKLTATATVAARYKENITWDAKPAAEITTVDAGAKGLTGGSSPPPRTRERSTKRKTTTDKDKKDADQPKKKGGFLSKMNLSGGSQAQSSQTVASAGGRAVGNDNNAKGGSQPAASLA